MRVYLNLGYRQGGDAQGDGLYGIEGVIGSGYADFLVGKDDRNVLRGEGGNDTLVGLGGDDELEGGAGADELFGDAGFDYASYKSSSAGVIVDLDGSASSLAATPRATLFSIEGVIGSAFADFFSATTSATSSAARAAPTISRLRRQRHAPRRRRQRLPGRRRRRTTSCAAAPATTPPTTPTRREAVMVDLASRHAPRRRRGGDRLSGIENLLGTFYNDRLAGNAAANRLEGARAPTCSPGGAAPTGSSTARRTTACPRRPTASSTSAARQGDKIDLASIDANEQATGNQAFTVHRPGASSPAPGQLRFFQQNGDTIIEANTTDLTAGAEMRIVLDPLVSLQASDFFL